MKYIRQISVEDIESLKEILDKYNLPKKLPNSKGEMLQLKEIGDFVYNHCESLIPERFIKLLKTLDSLNKTNEYLEFKEELIKDLILNNKVRHLYTKSIKEGLYIKSNDKLIRTTIENVNDLYNHDKFNSESSRAYSDIIDKHIKNFFYLTESIKPNKSNNRKQETVTHANIPSIAANFLIYTGITYTKFHKKWEEGSIDNYDHLKEHTHIFMKLINRYSESKDIEFWLFENTYNIKLINDIIRNTNGIDEDDLFKVFKYLSLSCLLSNINSRGKIIKLVTENKRLIVRDEDEYGNGYGSLNYNEKEINIWIDIVKEIILQMALIAIPIMELYLYYLILQDNIIDELKLFENIELIQFDISEKYQIEDFNFIWKRFRQIYKIFDEEVLKDIIYEIDYEIDYEFDEEMDEYTSFINELPENKVIAIIEQYKEYFK